MKWSLESVSTLQQATEQGLLAKGGGEKASEWPSLLCSSIHRAEFDSLEKTLMLGKTEGGRRRG